MSGDPQPLRDILPALMADLAQRRLIGSAEAARRLGVSSKTVRRMCERGELDYVEVGGRYRVPRAELNRAVGKGVTR